MRQTVWGERVYDQSMILQLTESLMRQVVSLHAACTAVQCASSCCRGGWGITTQRRLTAQVCWCLTKDNTERPCGEKPSVTWRTKESAVVSWVCPCLSVSITITQALLTCCFPAFIVFFFLVWVFMGVLLSLFAPVSPSLPFFFAITVARAAVVISPSVSFCFLVFMSTFGLFPLLLVFSSTAVIAAAVAAWALLFLTLLLLLFLLFLLSRGFFGSFW